MSISSSKQNRAGRLDFVFGWLFDDWLLDDADLDNVFRGSVGDFCHVLSNLFEFVAREIVLINYGGEVVPDFGVEL